MHPEKVIFLNDLNEMVKMECHRRFALDANTDEDAASQLLGVNASTLTELLKRVVLYFPDLIFYRQNTQQRHLILSKICQAFILFQAQENITDPNYECLLLNFADFLYRDICIEFFDAEVIGAN